MMNSESSKPTNVGSNDQLGVAPKRDRVCRLPECQGKPRCATCVALDAAYPPSPPPQTFGIIDPDYARVFTQARIIAWSYGYACLAHGSFTRDLDLLLVPWTDAAQPDDVDYFAPRIADAAGLKISHPPSVRPHGRKTWTLLFPGFADPRWVDLSVLTPNKG
jgi:hypothetical protein